MWRVARVSFHHFLDVISALQIHRGRSKGSRVRRLCLSSAVPALLLLAFTMSGHLLLMQPTPFPGVSRASRNHRQFDAQRLLTSMDSQLLSWSWASRSRHEAHDPPYNCFGDNKPKRSSITDGDDDPATAAKKARGMLGCLDVNFSEVYRDLSILVHRDSIGVVAMHR